VLLILLICIISGCAGSLGFVKKGFVPSESLCLDGLVVNIDAANCQSIYFGNIPEWEVMKVRCVYSESVGVWTQSTFYAVTHAFQDPNPEWRLICHDPFIAVYVDTNTLPYLKN